MLHYILVFFVATLCFPRLFASESVVAVPEIVAAITKIDLTNPQAPTVAFEVFVTKKICGIVSERKGSIFGLQEVKNSVQAC